MKVVTTLHFGLQMLYYSYRVATTVAIRRLFWSDVVVETQKYLCLQAKIWFSAHCLKVLATL